MNLVALQDPNDLHLSPDDATAERLRQVIFLQLQALGIRTGLRSVDEVTAADWLRGQGYNIPYGPDTLYWAASKLNEVTTSRFYT
jgi:hypothetical protein